MIDLAAFRRTLHRRPEVSGAEARTAATIAAALPPGLRVTRGLGGHGLAAEIAGAAPGPTVMVRSELDALPIPETGAVAWASEVPGVGHLCGHDGHATILLGLAHRLAARPPARGRVVLLWQPAEETGAGAAAVIADPAFAALAPDWAFAVHSMPGVPRGTAWLRAGTALCASRGLAVRLTGRTAHAGAPEDGVSPAPALARLVLALPGLSRGAETAPGFRLVTVTHARLGARSYGIAPGEAELCATIRAWDDAGLDALEAEARGLIAAEAQGLGAAVGIEDDFAATVNDADAVAAFRPALARAGFALAEGEVFRGSEDFGRFGAAGARAAMAFLGAGDGPALHAPDFDFDDGLIEPGVTAFEGVVRDLLG